jgi:predicted Rossmann-fold nucleotide-binding protein
MAGRLPVITVIASGQQCAGSAQARAEAVGGFVAAAGCNLLTGGGGGTMTEVGRSFFEAPFRVGHAIGILPGAIPGIGQPGQELVAGQYYRHRGRTPNDWVQFAVNTHLPGDNPRDGTSRNYLNILSADLVIVLAGGGGTEAELDIAVALGKPVIALLGEDEMVGSYSANNLPGAVECVSDARLLEGLASSYLAPLALARPTFQSLKSYYNTNAGSVHRCTVTFPNTCAVRMSEALSQAVPGIIDKFRASGLNICPHGYMRGAQDLAAVLRRADVFGIYNQGFEAPGQAPASLQGQKGIVCYMNIPSYPDGQGHIDLWDGTGPVGSAYWDGNPIWFWRLS